jgi:hypothetical protein
VANIRLIATIATTTMHCNDKKKRKRKGRKKFEQLILFTLKLEFINYEQYNRVGRGIDVRCPSHINNFSGCILVHHFINATNITLILTYK